MAKVKRDPKVEKQHARLLESFISALESEAHADEKLPDMLRRLAKKDREDWRKEIGEGILVPGNHQTFASELQDELVDFVNYAYFMLFLIDHARVESEERGEPLDGTVDTMVGEVETQLHEAIGNVGVAWENVQALHHKGLRKYLDQADKQREQAEREAQKGSRRKR
jgi:hypothetical protein